MPSSYTISDDLTQVGDDPVADGGVSEVWKGTYNGRKVCIKNLKVSEQVRQAVERVSTWSIFFLPLKDVHGHVGVLQGGNHMEKVETSKRRCFHWCHETSFAICLRVDAEWHLDGLCQR